MGLFEVYINDGRKVVATAGTREALVAASSPATKVVIMAEVDNTGVIAVGGLNVVAAIATRRGIPLYASEAMTLEISDLNTVYLDTNVSGDGVTFVYMA